MKKISVFLTIIMSACLLGGCVNNQAIKTLNDDAKALMESGDVQGAVCRLESSLVLDSEKYQTRYNLGVAYIELGDFEKAKQNLEMVRSIKPDFPEVYYSLGVMHENSAYALINRSAEVALDSEEAISSDSALSEDEIKIVISELNEAIDSYNKYLEVTKDKSNAEEIENQIRNINKTIEKYGPQDLGNEQ